ncbi:glycoside hydrolase family 3 N-terminal domain-containing protein [Silvibacterium sp.]|uniref:glycoside hydrolase family 3 protein n=1 Tax=Silvibacterium sp. TaxID=1964179 RepID=UPI0039E2A498
MQIKFWFAGALAAQLSIPQALPAQSVHQTIQPALSTRSVPTLHRDGLEFRDLNRDGKLEPFEDWRLPAQERTADLLERMSLEEKAGLMVHGTLPSFGPLAALGVGEAYDLDKVRAIVANNKVNTFITRLTPDARDFAHQNNAVQEIAEGSRWAIPVTISSDPRHHFQAVLGASVQDATFSLWPGALGFGAIGDPTLTRKFADIVRQEYLSVGIRESLAPQADLLTEPRWARGDGTFGASATVDREMVEAYVAGVQHGESGLNSSSVMAVVKHWAGYGAAKDGWDSHNYYGRFATFPGNNFAEHLIPFEGAFTAHVASVMPTYSILQNLQLNGKPVEQVGSGFNRQLLSGLLRQANHFQGAVVSDWAITNDCNTDCQNGTPANQKPTPADIGMPWGVQQLTQEQRFAKAINAGVDQIGGTEDSPLIVAAVHAGLISEARVNEAAGRILLQKFQMGLFEAPFVDEDKAAEVAGKPAFVEEGRRAQAAATVLLKNGPSRAGSPLLPLTPAGQNVYLFGIDKQEAERHGLHVVDDPSKADLVIIHAPSPFQSEHPNYFFGSRQHEGRLYFTNEDAVFRALEQVKKRIPIVFVTTLERPLILTDILPRVNALLGDFGIADGPLLDVLTGRISPQGHLPFNLPRSEKAVEDQKSDVPDDDVDPLFKAGAGLAYSSR